ncbi:carbon storage regulator CsrA [Campylobacter pinnipediorum]|uniref:Translational regulator CsrA n=2 Tax=Campylobacter pinnipediorum TaxID=1965231 RepID=A0A1S6U730_9BACT|nr:carbon storage regulator CsrA [Campylobacter pinnipediorum]AQW80957.1 carbon storage regulator [Campylobacter pinnipediorum subsp. pinnipediorum]AQW82572.1 carbon storage regulator [Campylobacter pinnipediorum subsp. pinnipediorum]AQW84257.1 carbon storage regulator [Campylobacter pinnipediorum subsp. pinnipediorum]AQW85882.1 carbon storage regulator [Campylobacter pinnipediorum subsp. caledonicus]AQW87490.1 carbon storage regulator [Campylobacter pinnipediorum subsp. caledonicus]
MLILSRKENEEILLGNDIKLVVVSINKGAVKLGIEAPKNTMILRSELANQIKDSNKQASKDVPCDSFDELRKKIEK